MIDIIIFGAGQQGRVCKRLAEENSFRVKAFVDDYKTGFVEGVPVYKSVELVKDFQTIPCITAVGDTLPRERFICEINRLGLKTINLIDRMAIIEHGAIIGTGNYIGKNAIVYASAYIGDHNIINTNAIVATDAVIGNGNNISLACNICGGVSIGDYCYIGCHSSIVSGVHIGSGSTVGAGAVVLRDVESQIFVAGVPAIKKERLQK